MTCIIFPQQCQKLFFRQQNLPLCQTQKRICQTKITDDIKSIFKLTMIVGTLINRYKTVLLGILIFLLFVEILFRPLWNNQRAKKNNSETTCHLAKKIIIRLKSIFVGNSCFLWRFSFATLLVLESSTTSPLSTKSAISLAEIDES